MTSLHPAPWVLLLGLEPKATNYVDRDAAFYFTIDSFAWITQRHNGMWQCSHHLGAWGRDRGFDFKSQEKTEEQMRAVVVAYIKHIREEQVA